MTLGIKSRDEFPELLSQLGRTDRIVELGVAKGDFSYRLLDGSEVKRLYSIDRWAGDRGHGCRQYFKASEKLSVFGTRSVVLRMKFKNAVGQFEDESLDFVYVDGYAHTGQAGGETLEMWWPKVRPGGVFGGHDYDEAWPRTVEAVDKFLESIGRRGDLVVTSGDKPRSWYLIK